MLARVARTTFVSRFANKAAKPTAVVRRWASTSSRSSSSSSSNTSSAHHSFRLRCAGLLGATLATGCVLRPFAEENEDAEEDDTDDFASRKPLARLNAALAVSDIPIDLRSTFVINLMLGGGVIMYWSAMWNIIDHYFVPRLVPVPGANAILRLAVGLFLLWFPDGDIKEIGDYYEEDLEEDFDVRDDDDDDDEGDATTTTGKSVSGADKVGDLAGHQVRELVDSRVRLIFDEKLHDQVTRLVLKAILRNPDFLSKEFVMRSFDDADTSGDGMLSGEELEAALHKLVRSGRNAAGKKDQEEEEEEEVDRFATVEKVLESCGITLNLHDKFFHNVWVGTGIIFVWSGVERCSNVFFFPKAIPHPLANNLLRVVFAFGTLWLATGNFDHVGDGYLADDEEDEDDDENVGIKVSTFNHIVDDTLRRQLTSQEDGTLHHHRIRLSRADVAAAFDQVDSDDNGVISADEFARAFGVSAIQPKL